MKSVIVVLLVIGLCVPGLVWAADNAAPAADASKTPDVKSLGQWWLRNAKTYDPAYPGFLYHIEGNYTLMKLEGNLDMTSHTGQGGVWLRKNIVTSMTNYSIGKTKTSMLGGATTETENQGFQQTIQVDLTKRFSGIAGMMWKMDGAKYLEDRTTYYGGIYASILDTPQYKLAAGAFYGNEETAYMNDKIQQLNPYASIPTYKSNGAYFIENFNLTLMGGGVGFNQSAEYLMYFKDSDFYHWKVTFGAHVMISATTGVFANYIINEDNNSFVELGKALGYQERDTAIVVGFMVNLPK